MTFDSLTNEREYFPAFYLDEILPKQLRGGLLKEWSAKERQGEATPRQGLRDLSGPYLNARATLLDTAGRFNGTVDTYAVAAQEAAERALKALGSDGAKAPAVQKPVPGPEIWAEDGGTEGRWRTTLHTWHTCLLRALGYTPSPGVLTVRGATGGLYAVPVAHAEDQIVVLTGGFATTVDAALAADGAGRLPAPVRVASGKRLETVGDLASWLFNADNPPRYALLLFGGVMILADREGFPRGRYLAVSLDVALPRKGAKGTTAGELDVIAALFAAGSLRPRDDGSEDEVARFLTESRDHSVGVTGELREGLKKSVHLIANEVLTRLREQGVDPADIGRLLPGVVKENDLPKVLTDESLRYLYRILFLLYAEARPGLDILPMKSDEYVAGYSVARLRELVAGERLTGSHARTGHHFNDSLALLFEKVYTGHPVADTVSTRDAATTVTDEDAPAPADDGHVRVRIEALRSRLFKPDSIELVGRIRDCDTPGGDPGLASAPRTLDLRLRNHVLHQVLRHLTVVEGKGRNGRGGFISYAQLGINQLGAVYEGLMSYTGFIADEPLYEVAKGGDPTNGSWLITGGQVASGRYPDGGSRGVFVKDRPDRESGELISRVHPVGSYVYRLAGRDRQTSASYYTPESLTRATVEQALRFRLHPDGAIDPRAPDDAEVTAADVLTWRICEPALGSGAFLNEAINQLAELYLRLAQRDTGEEIDTERKTREEQKVKAYIALHNAYGVDLNSTAVELAEVSLWLNTMYRGMKAPWYGLHLHRGNSLIGASRKVYPGNALHEGGWLRTKDQRAPEAVPLGRALPGQAVHQFLLPALGWGSVAEEVSLRKPRKGAGSPADAPPKAVVAGAEADWLDPALIEAMKAWRASIRRAPKSAGKGKGKKTDGGARGAVAATVVELGAAASVESAPRVDVQVEEEAEESGQVAFDLGLNFWQQGKLSLTGGSGVGSGDGAGSGGSRREKRGMKAVRRVTRSENKREDDEREAQVGRLMALAQRVEYLWKLVVRRLRLSEQEIARTVDVWGADNETMAKRRTTGDGKVMDRDAVVAALTSDGSPYWRLKQLMDAWCALWFWPLDEIGLLDGTADVYFWDDGTDLTKLKKGFDKRRLTALKNLDDWIEFAEAVVGRVNVDSGKGQVTFFEVEDVEDLDELDRLEEALDQQMIKATAWEESLNLGDRFPWYGRVAVQIARDRGFFHWELEFAHVFEDGGFDLMVGNPPWVKQEWKEGEVLAEFEPWFELADKPSNEEWAERKAEVLTRSDARSAFLGELAGSAAVSGFLSSVDAYPLLVGTQPDLYRAFMLLSWRAVGKRGVAGLIHPSTHLTGTKEGVLRKAAYRHLRLHADFVNELYLFAKPVDHSTHFSVHIYGGTRDIRFLHMSWLLHPQVLVRSLRHSGEGPLPGIKKDGTWDLRPHRDRALTVEQKTLSAWRDLTSEEKPPPVEQTKLLFPVTIAEESAIASLASWPRRLDSLGPRIARGFDEKNDRTAGYFTWDSGPAENWHDVILQGPFFGIATPFAKRPIDGARTSVHLEHWNHLELAEDEVPRTNYRRAKTCSPAKYSAATGKKSWCDHDLLRDLKTDPDVIAELEAVTSDKAEQEVLLGEWATRPYSRFFRVAWRRQIASNTERSLFACLVPPGPAHIDAVNSMALSSMRETAVVAGFWASLPLDYLLRATGRSDLRIGEAKVMPAPIPGHPLTDTLLLRTLRLNCQTNAYAPLWAELYTSDWLADSWAAEWPGLVPLTEKLGPQWSADTPLRAERARRAALVELDALVAVWLGIGADELIAMYRSRFPVLQQYEENMWFDAAGRRIAKAHQVHGYGQPKDAWAQLSAHEDFPEAAKVPDGYTGPVRRADREAEMRAAHAEFTRRMRAVGWEPGKVEPTE
ncbi:Eco57I restriction-modification methylase domain-containing protein [Streptomyces sp. NRRL F-5135]|uniref:Eco57I restriction-modification methylase domain-containing protein n=1 Tax=Streptomyces sp. NRRL F-5135 TaxID=1463858 RepID=UPI0006925396|nr:DNA methyltransferase [Streptomyces sp. NRRL F-5135]